MMFIVERAIILNCFSGHLSKEKLDFLYEEGLNSSGNNFTFWYGHYPSSIMTYDSFFGLRSIIGKFGSVYLNGHFHSIHGIAPIQYALQSNGKILQIYTNYIIGLC